jgi:hypothetical protein
MALPAKVSLRRSLVKPGLGEDLPLLIGGFVAHRLGELAS